MVNAVVGIAKKEIMDNVRNKWIVLISVLFASLTLVVSYFGSIFSEGWQDFGGTISGMMVYIQLMMPIIGLMLGYAAIVGEIERGSMGSLLSLPLTRSEVLLGKFLGLGGTLSLTILIGFGVAGVVIAVNVSGVNYVDYLIFIGATIFLGLVFLSLALFLSSLFKKRSTAMGGAIFLWFFFNMILPIILTGLLVADVGLKNLGSILSGEISAPIWYHELQLLNPLTPYSVLVSLNVKPVSIMQRDLPIPYPSFYTTEFMISVLVVWITVFLCLTFWMFKDRDI